MNHFTIKDLEKLSGIKAHTLRIWEQRYNLLIPDRTETNIRVYSNTELKKILNIALLNQHGIKISQISKMTLKQIEENVILIGKTDLVIEKLIKELIEAMLEFETQKFESTVNVYLYESGLESTIVDLLFPFLNRIGVLWQANKLNPAQEHFVINIIRQKIIVAIDKLENKTTNVKTAILFLPEGEFHEIGLLYVHYLLKKVGVSCIYLGTNVPMLDLENTALTQNSSLIYTHLTTFTQRNNMKNIIAELKKISKNCKIVLSGLQAQQITEKLPLNFLVIKTIKELDNFVKSV